MAAHTSSGIRTSVWSERPLEPLMACSATSGSTPIFASASSPSLANARCAAFSPADTAFTACAEPSSPQYTI